MVSTMKLRKQGGSLAVTLPKDVVRVLGVRVGEALHLVQVGPGEFRLTPHDPETVSALKAHDKIMAEYRDAFRALAE
jgi:putative addiction module antidote